MGSAARVVETQMSREASCGEMVGRSHTLHPEHMETEGSSEGQGEGQGELRSNVGSGCRGG